MNAFLNSFGRIWRAIVLGLVPGILLVFPHISAAAEVSDTARLADLSLEELLNMEITTLSRKAEDLADAPAAVFVISQTDIQRSGARTIPDLLRLVPGMQVAQIDSNKWAVTARGANGRFANKLLVLMDGRALYSPMLSGVYWDVQDTDLAAIDRIEVIRGPGATMWGANAVNGVVNIITKSATETQGGHLDLMTGSDGSEGLVRYGGETDSVAYRFFGKFFDREGGLDLQDEDAGDIWEMARAGGRVDWLGEENREMSFVAEVYSGTIGETGVTRMLAPPYQTIVDNRDDLSGGFALHRWSREFDNGGNVQIRSYLTHEHRDGNALGEKRNTFDFDLQHSLNTSDKHDLMWGLAYRRSKDKTTSSFQIEIMPESFTNERISTFIQDDIKISERFRVIVGSKFEKNNFSEQNIEFEPSIRFSLRLDDANSIWAAASRANRVPSRGERDGNVISQVIPPGFPPFSFPVPLVVKLSGDQSIRSEKVLAYEFGYRFRAEETYFDVALFYNDYGKLRSVRHGDSTCQPTGTLLADDPLCVGTATYVETPLVLENGFRSTTLGVEAWVSREINDWWHLQAGYSYYHTDEPTNANPLQLQFAEDSPAHLMSIRSSMDLPQNLSLDLWLRYVDELETQQIDSYTAMDVRLAWSSVSSIELAVVGRNLIAGDHVEFVSELGDLVPIQIEPTAYMEIRWNF